MNDLENTVLSERSQSQETPYCGLLFVWNTQDRAVPQRQWAAGGQGQGDAEGDGQFCWRERGHFLG